ncbi:HD-GYP hydrolase domain containing protein [Caldisalinibacter kiritimatiensis]|uniref:HD-GYP hydrolase domain containing protein n=1 Tax=Caldisalinibacter kiritimatiensis TaxID=1304284 RepID=R1AV85_9FIRM|nr:HD-GYP hydrolase domain containing protein [Caldisalinibacter kiritimatiensis]
MYIDHVQSGSVLGRTVYISQKGIWLHRGITLNKGLIEGLKKHGIEYIEINNEDYKDSISENIKIEIIKTIYDSFNYNIKRNLILNPYKENNGKQIKKYLNVFENLSEVILKNKQILSNLMEIKLFDLSTYIHSWNVCILCIMLGVSLGLDNRELMNLAVGALLHDIGKLFIPEDVLFKKDKCICQVKNPPEFN